MSHLEPRGIPSEYVLPTPDCADFAGARARKSRTKAGGGRWSSSHRGNSPGSWRYPSLPGTLAACRAAADAVVGSNAVWIGGNDLTTEGSWVWEDGLAIPGPASVPITFDQCHANIDCGVGRSEEHTSELQSLANTVCRLLLEKKKHSRMLTTASH